MRGERRGTRKGRLKTTMVRIGGRGGESRANGGKIGGGRGRTERVFCFFVAVKEGRRWRFLEGVGVGVKGG